MVPPIHLDFDYRRRGSGYTRVQGTPGVAHEVSPKEWPEILPIFREPGRNYPVLRVADYYSTTRVFNFDLGSMPGVQHIAGIRRMTFETTALQRANDRFSYWSAGNYPSIVENITFDVGGLDPNDKSGLEFRIVPFNTFPAPTNNWASVEGIQPFSPNAWMSNGQGAAILWKTRKRFG